MSKELATPKQYTLLIVEDDPETSLMLQTYFEGEGYVVWTAAWGNEAIGLCQTKTPDLIIQDIRLPDIDGYQVVKELRKNARTSHVPIIFLTEKHTRDDKIAGLRLGAVAYLPKPFDIQELRLRVRNALRRTSLPALVSPVTGLPVRQVAEEWLHELGDKNDWGVIYVAIQDVDTFSDSYGFVAGDDVLRAVGLIMGHVIDDVGSLDDQVAHIEETSFVLVTTDTRARSIQDRLASRLERAFRYFYPAKDTGTRQTVPHMRVDMAMITHADGPFDGPQAIIDAAIANCQTVVVGSGTQS
jgi:PleD family two-component response regulator